MSYPKTRRNQDIVADGLLTSTCVGWWDFTKINTSTGVVTDQGPNGNDITITLAAAPTISGGYCQLSAAKTGIVLPTFTVAADGAVVVAWGVKKVASETITIGGTGAGTESLIVGNAIQGLRSSTGNNILNDNAGHGTAGDENLMMACNNETFTSSSVPTSFDLTVDILSDGAVVPAGVAAAVALTSVVMAMQSCSKLGIWNLANPPSDAALAACVEWMDAEWALGNRVPYPLLAQWT